MLIIRICARTLKPGNRNCWINQACPGSLMEEINYTAAYRTRRKCT